jgi:prepilin-type N-terminal cleavage/methylation domain-containing protein
MNKPFPSHKSDINNQAFTLVELSIVLLIIGLIIGGITAGTSLINQSKLRSILNEQNNYITAINSFRLQYGYYPGDFNNAYSFWSTSSNCTSAATCNGNGNWLIEWPSEATNTWNHLNLASMINTNYTSSAPEPTSKYGNSQWRLENFAGWTGSLYTVLNGTTNGLEIVGATISSAQIPFISPIDAYSIDKKIDDGMPSNGKIFAMSEQNNGCILQADGVTYAAYLGYNSNAAIYNLPQPSLKCSRIIFWL